MRRCTGICEATGELQQLRRPLVVLSSVHCIPLVKSHPVANPRSPRRSLRRRPTTRAAAAPAGAELAGGAGYVVASGASAAQYLTDKLLNDVALPIALAFLAVKALGWAATACEQARAPPPTPPHPHPWARIPALLELPASALGRAGTD